MARARVKEISRRNLGRARTLHSSGGKQFKKIHGISRPKKTALQDSTDHCLVARLKRLYPFSDRIDEVLLDIFYPPVGGKVTLQNLANPDTVRAEFARFKAAVKSVGQTFEVEDLINDLIERSVLGVQVQTTSGPREFYEYSSDKAYRLREADAVCLHNAISDYFLDRVKA